MRGAGFCPTMTSRAAGISARMRGRISAAHQVIASMFGRKSILPVNTRIGSTAFEAGGVKNSVSTPFGMTEIFAAELSNAAMARASAAEHAAMCAARVQMARSYRSNFFHWSNE